MTTVGIWSHDDCVVRLLSQPGLWGAQKLEAIPGRIPANDQPSEGCFDPRITVVDASLDWGRVKSFLILIADKANT